MIFIYSTNSYWIGSFFKEEDRTAITTALYYAVDVFFFVGGFFMAYVLINP